LEREHDLDVQPWCRWGRTHHDYAVTSYVPSAANFGINFFEDGHIAGMPDESLDVSIIANGADPLISPLSLNTIPNTLADWAARFAVAITGSGTFDYQGTAYDFTLTDATIAATPLPASLGLMVTALAGLGAATWRKRTPRDARGLHKTAGFSAT
jgi:hypothetical protein